MRLKDVFCNCIGKNPAIPGGGVGGGGGGGGGDSHFLAGGASIQLRPGLRSLHRRQGGRPCQGARAAAGGKVRLKALQCALRLT